MNTNRWSCDWTERTEFITGNTSFETNWLFHDKEEKLAKTFQGKRNKSPGLADHKIIGKVSYYNDSFIFAQRNRSRIHVGRFPISFQKIDLVVCQFFHVWYLKWHVFERYPYSKQY